MPPPSCSPLATTRHHLLSMDLAPNCRPTQRTKISAPRTTAHRWWLARSRYAVAAPTRGDLLRPALPLVERRLRLDDETLERGFVLGARHHLERRGATARDGSRCGWASPRTAPVADPARKPATGGAAYGEGVPGSRRRAALSLATAAPGTRSIKGDPSPCAARLGLWGRSDAEPTARGGRRGSVPPARGGPRGAERRDLNASWPPCAPEAPAGPAPTCAAPLSPVPPPTSAADNAHGGSWTFQCSGPRFRRESSRCSRTAESVTFRGRLEARVTSRADAGARGDAGAQARGRVAHASRDRAPPRMGAERSRSPLRDGVRHRLGSASALGSGSQAGSPYVTGSSKRIAVQVHGL